MKKYVMICIVVIMMLVPMVGASNLLSTNKIVVKTPVNVYKEDFTHTVFVEYATTTTCGYCPTASSQLYSIYNSGNYDFYYVSLVANMNDKAYQRVKQLGVTGVPDVYFDGGYKRLLGAQTDETPYINAIIQCGERTVPNIDIEVSVKWIGSAILRITVNVQNNEAEEYNGELRVYIVEPVSRWNDASSKPYHFGVLDIPVVYTLAVPQTKPLQLPNTYTIAKLWIGSLYGFGDITKDNIMVIATLFDKNSDYAVESASAVPTSGSSSPQGINQVQVQSSPQVNPLPNQHNNLNIQQSNQLLQMVVKTTNR